MKLKILVSFILIIATVAAAQEHHDLHGVWTVDFEKTVMYMDRQTRLRYDSLPAQVKNNMRNSFQGRTFTFNANNAVTINFEFKGRIRQVEGAFAYRLEDRILTIKAENSTSDYLIEWETPRMIHLIYKDVGSRGLLRSLWLTRN